MSFIPKNEYPNSGFYILGTLRNSDKGDLIIDKILVDGLELFPDFTSPNVVEKNKIIEVSLLLNKKPDKESTIRLFALDYEENVLQYSLICDFSEKYTEIRRVLEVNNHE